MARAKTVGRRTGRGEPKRKSISERNLPEGPELVLHPFSLVEALRTEPEIRTPAKWVPKRTSKGRLNRQRHTRAVK
jgi:hypothetical protein